MIMFKNINKKKWFLYALVIFLLSFYFNHRNASVSAVNVSYSQFMKELNENKVKSINIHNSYSKANEIYYTFDVDKPEGKRNYFKVLVPSFEHFWQKFDSNDKFKNIEVKTTPIPTESLIVTLIKSIIPLALFFGIFLWMQRESMSFMSRGKAQLIKPNNIDISFSDVIGIDDIKEEVMEIVDFLKKPEKFSEHNAKMPKGIILSGQPGTGKTMLAKALAKEAGVPFYYCSGSSFVEMFVGLGASRVRSLFAEAKENAPCIIFIDEIDTIGGKRGNRVGMSAHDEREGTLNELLTQMDGMATNNGVFIMGATNRLDMLDSALIRAGRFDRQLTVPMPSFDGRSELLTKLCKQYKIADDIDINEMARALTGRSGAEITNLMNEAAILQVRKNKPAIDKECFHEALDKLIMGMSNGAKMSEKDRRMTAYHEAGHAVVSMFLPETDPVHKVTITPRGNALGVTMMLPEEDRTSKSKTHLLSEISVLLAGFCAEQKFCGDVSTGASNDIERATAIANAMVKRLGMGSNLQQYVYTEVDGFGGESMNSLSEQMRVRIEQEIEDIFRSRKEATNSILEKYQSVIEKMVERLLDKEVVTEHDLYEITSEVLPENEIPEYLVKWHQQFLERKNVNSNNAENNDADTTD